MDGDLGGEKKNVYKEDLVTHKATEDIIENCIR